MSESSAKPAATVDTNVFVSGIIFRRGNPFALRLALRRGAFVLVLSDEQYDELTNVFHRSTIVERYDIDRGDLAELLGALADTPRVEPIASLPVLVRDRKDDKILAAALGGGADYLVTGDKDLLALAGDPRLGSLKIVTVVEFLDVLDRRSTPPSEDDSGG
jgi:putative PIN family toxin of toxin-antitoxin system